MDADNESNEENLKSSSGSAEAMVGDIKSSLEPVLALSERLVD
ncbi:MAG: hypothetical protein QF437_05995 [Planctomycetota bacterium]|nr:hypothetical protein [Planctomycetota bacterium]MDP7130019.1 hypothetical protein [Planctomycetota bacterium]MDP7252954.1 hypothetical protein [Planctomycetota bacterium]